LVDDIANINIDNDMLLKSSCEINLYDVLGYVIQNTFFAFTHPLS